MRSNKPSPFEPDYAVAPGLTVKECMEATGYTQKEFATRVGVSVQSLMRIFQGEQPITPATASALEKVTGVVARFWNTLESNYREQLQSIEEKKQLEAQENWTKNFPVKEL